MDPDRLAALDLLTDTPLGTTNHIELYDDPRLVGPAIDRAASWLAPHLPAASSPEAGSANGAPVTAG